MCIRDRAIEDDWRSKPSHRMLPNQWTGSTVFKLRDPKGAPAPAGDPKRGGRTAAPALPNKAEFQALG
eukprot:11776389-Alexandrium_andersonii.AAC.1